MPTHQLITQTCCKTTIFKIDPKPCETDAHRPRRHVARHPQHHKPGTCHHTRSQHHYTRKCKRRIDPTPTHLRTRQDPRMNSREFSSGSRRSKRRLGRERVIVFERFSDQARHVVTPSPPEPPRTHHQNWRRHRTPTRPRSSGAGCPGAAALTSWGRHQAGTRQHTRGAQRTCGLPSRRATSRSPAKTKNVLESSLRKTALLGHEEHQHRPPPPGPARQPRLHQRPDPHRPRPPVSARGPVRQPTTLFENASLALANHNTPFRIGPASLRAVPPCAIGGVAAFSPASTWEPLRAWIFQLCGAVMSTASSSPLPLRRAVT